MYIHENLDTNRGIGAMGVSKIPVFIYLYLSLFGTRDVKPEIDNIEF